MPSASAGPSALPLNSSSLSDGDCDRTFWTPRRIARITWAFVALGVALRLVRYLRNYPLWGDEAFLAANFLERGYRDLIGTLEYHQISPVGFLWAELTVVKLLGFSELSLRLVPTIASIASLFVFRHVAGRLVRGVPLALSVAILAVAFYPIRHGAEVKPYATDLLVALGFLTLAVEWLRRPERTGWLWALTALAPVGLLMSHPAVLVAGGVSLALAWPVWNRRRSRTLLAFGAYNLALVGAFGAVYVLSTGAQSTRELESLQDYWSTSFPPLEAPWQVLPWFVLIHTGNLFAFPIGGEHGASAATFLCFLAAVAALAKARRWTVLTLMLAPFALGLIAAGLKRYPYGGQVRFMLYLAPAICLMASLGAVVLLNRIGQERLRRWATAGSLLACAVLGAILIGRDLAKPYRTIYDMRARQFAQWFWTEKARDGELACMKTDFELIFNPKHWEFGRSAVYLCNQKIYSPRHREGRPLNWQAIAEDRPLRCVLYNENPREHPTFVAWLDAMTQHYDLRRHEHYVVNAGGTLKLWHEDHVYVYEFVPKGAEPSPPQVAVSIDWQPVQR